MALVSLELFLPEVLPLVQGCAQTTALNAIRNAAIEFCSDTMFWQDTQDPLTLTSNDFPYQLPAPSGARCIQPLTVAVDGFNLTPTTIDDLDNSILNWRAQIRYPEKYFQPNPDELVLFPLPKDPVSLVLRLAYTPLRTAETIGDYVYQNHLETIAWGALAKLLAIPQQPWTNVALADYFGARFDAAKSNAGIEARKAYNRVGLKVQFRRF